MSDIINKLGEEIINRNEFNQFCQSLAGARHVVQWRGSDVWKIGGKVFAIGGNDADNSTVYTFKTTETNFLYLSECRNYKPAPYFASRGMKWIQHTHSESAHNDELQYYLSDSHRIVFSSLTKAKQLALTLDIEVTQE